MLRERKKNNSCLVDYSYKTNNKNLQSKKTRFLKNISTFHLSQVLENFDWNIEIVKAFHTFCSKLRIKSEENPTNV